MRPGSRIHFEDPFNSRHDFSHALAFLVAIALLVSIGVLVFRGTSWLVAGDLQASEIPVIAAKSVASSARTPVATVTSVSAVATSPPIAVVMAATPPPAPASTPSSGTQRYRIGNTGGDGAFLRRSPRLADRMNAWPDNTILVDLGEEASGDGLTWRKVQAPNGSTGYMPTQWLVAVPGQ